MDPISSLGLASNVIQIIDFTGRIISHTHEISHSAEGVLESHTFLEDAANNLSELYQELAKNNTKSTKLSEADRQLLKLRRECQDVTKNLIDLLNCVKNQNPHDKWQSVRQAILCMWSQKDILAHETKLDSIRKQIGTALLCSLRYVLLLIRSNY